MAVTRRGVTGWLVLGVGLMIASVVSSAAAAPGRRAGVLVELPERGVPELQAALAADLDDLSAWEELAWLYFERSRTQPSYVVLVRQVLAQADEAQARVGRDSADLHATRGLLGLREGRLDVAVAHLEVAVHLDPGHLRAQFAIGEAALRMQDLARAQAAFQAIVAASAGQTDVEAWLSLGAVEARRGRLAEAEVAYAAALKLAPREPRVHFNVAGLQVRRLRKATGKPADDLALQVLASVGRVLAFTDGEARHAGLRVRAVDVLLELATAHRRVDVCREVARMVPLAGDEQDQAYASAALRVAREIERQQSSRIARPEERERLLRLEAEEMRKEAEAGRKEAEEQR